MNLTPEEREIGKQNFQAAVGDNLLNGNRRDFLKAGLVAGAVPIAGAGAMYFGYEGKLEEPLRVGVIGTGDEGNVLIGALNPEYVQCVAIADIRPYSIWRAFYGDNYSPTANKARPGLLKVYGWRNEDEARETVAVYEEGYEALLDDPNVEAVIIALPLHLHHEAAIRAMRKGKHVLTEKLMGKTVSACKEMGRVSEATGMLLATGHQRHYSVLYANAVDTIQRGLIGDVHHIRAQWHRSNLPGKDSWSQPLPVGVTDYLAKMDEIEYDSPEYKAATDAFKKGRRKYEKQFETEAEKLAARRRFLLKYKLIDEWFAWNRKLAEVEAKSKDSAEIELWRDKVKQKQSQLSDYVVDAAKYGYADKASSDGPQYSALEELIRWRLWKRTGGGLMAELGSHQLDAASIFISAQRDDGKKVLPLTVMGVGGRHVFPADRECADHVYCSFEFPGKGYYKDYETREIADKNKKIVVTYSSINGNGYGGYGEVVMGTKGTLILEREQEVMLFQGASTSTKVSVVVDKDGPTLDTQESGEPAAAVATATAGPPSRGYQEEIEHWAWCVRNGASNDDLRCGPKVAMADAIIALTSNIAIDQERKISFKPEWFEIDQDATPEVDEGVSGAVPPRQADQIS